MENNLLIKNINDLEEYLRIYKELQAMIKIVFLKGQMALIICLKPSDKQTEYLWFCFTLKRIQFLLHNDQQKNVRDNPKS